MSTSTALPVADVSRLGQAVLAEVATVVVGMRSALEIALAAILAGGHVLFEDVPGLGKTLAARSLATTLGLDFRRLQCTPDLLPADITGSYVFDPAEGRFAFRPGPVFTGLLLADEINRTAPKTQSALLEAMAERQVTVEGTSFTLDQPFHVLATSNPVEYEGTYPLPEAQLDRFMVRLAVGYPDRAAEADVLHRRLDRRREEAAVRAVVDAATVRRCRPGSRRWRSIPTSWPTASPSPPAPGPTPPSRSGLRRAARWPSCWSPGPARSSPGGTSYCRRT